MLTGGPPPEWIAAARSGAAPHPGDLLWPLAEGRLWRGFGRVRGLAEFHGEITSKGYGYSRPGIERMPWDADQVEVTDPFGNRLRFNEYR